MFPRLRRQDKFVAETFFNVFDFFFQKHFVSSTNVSPFARRGNDVAKISGSRGLHFINWARVVHKLSMRSFFRLCSEEILFLARLRAQETSWDTIFPQQCFLVCRAFRLFSLGMGQEANSLRIFSYIYHFRCAWNKLWVPESVWFSWLYINACRML